MQGQQLLGVLVSKTTDFPWVQCEFKPTASFENIRSYFDEELKLLEADSMDAWQGAYSRINALGLRLIDAEKEEDVGEFLLHIKGDEAWFRSQWLCPKSREYHQRQLVDGSKATY